MHIGIIPDGNRRWAHTRQASLSQAYAIGFCRIVEVILALSQRGVQDVTVFGLSHANYAQRPQDQIEDLLTRIIDSVQTATALLCAEAIQVRFIGAIRDLSVQHHSQLLMIERQTYLESPLTRLNILVNYSPAWDLQPEGSYATSTIPYCDWIFRSGGNHRLSGFLPIQSSEAELHFSRKLWPDIRPIDVEKMFSKKARKNWGA